MRSGLGDGEASGELAAWLAGACRQVAVLLANVVVVVDGGFR